MTLMYCLGMPSVEAAVRRGNEIYSAMYTIHEWRVFNRPTSMMYGGAGLRYGTYDWLGRIFLSYDHCL